MTYPPNNPPWETAKQLSPDKAADPTSQVSTSNTNAGDGVSFKFTAVERANVAYIIEDQWPCVPDTGQIDEIVNRIEQALNEGWQTCDCHLTAEPGTVE